MVKKIAASQILGQSVSAEASLLHIKKILHSIGNRCGYAQGYVQQTIVLLCLCYTLILVFFFSFPFLFKDNELELKGKWMIKTESI